MQKDKSVFCAVIVGVVLLTAYKIVTINHLLKQEDAAFFIAAAAILTALVLVYYTNAYELYTAIISGAAGLVILFALSWRDRLTLGTVIGAVVLVIASVMKITNSFSTLRRNRFKKGYPVGMLTNFLGEMGVLFFLVYWEIG